MPVTDRSPWYRRRALLRAYDLATALAALIFLARGVVQLALYHRNDTGWLAVARIAMGYPLTIAAVGFGFWAVSRARRASPTEAVRGRTRSPSSAAEPVHRSVRADRLADRRLGLGQRDEQQLVAGLDRLLRRRHDHPVPAHDRDQRGVRRQVQVADRRARARRARRAG